MIKAICISGSVGTGKTTYAKKLSQKLNAKYIDVTSLIKEHKLYDEYDSDKKCYIIDINKLNKFLINLIRISNEQLIIDSHLSHDLPKKYVEKVIITKCELKELKQRLKNRGYSKKKIKENLEVEIFDICYQESLENKHNIEIISTSKTSIS